jgi:hypothetical protein
MEMDYLRAEATLAQAEQQAWTARDFDTLSRLYMPLQEARRQRRQRCGEGIVRLDLLAASNDDALNPEQLIEEIPHGQLLIAGWGSIAPALRFRELQSQRALYVETFLAAVYPIVGGSRAVVIVPHDGVALPPPREQSIDSLLTQITSQCLVMHEAELPRGPHPGTPETYGHTMSLWERLHAPFLAAADMQVDPLRRIEHYRHTICVDYACELAHQKLADVAKELARHSRQQSA